MCLLIFWLNAPSPYKELNTHINKSIKKIERKIKIPKSKISTWIKNKTCLKRTSIRQLARLTFLDQIMNMHKMRDHHSKAISS
jgi:hypothetical protein